jgi:hypothetical protein
LSKKGVAHKILQDKELRDVLASLVGIQMKMGGTVGENF